MDSDARPELLDERSAADWLSLSPLTLRRWRIQGLGPSYLKVGGRVFYERDGLRAYLESCRRESTSDGPPSVH